MTHLLARYAECVFWMARYMERAENLARIVDVNDTFSRGNRAGETWYSIVNLNADEERFRKRHPEPSARAVLHFYVLDQENPNSILSAVAAARENARTLRPLISTEMWAQLNIFYNALRELGPDDLARSDLTRLCATIKESCQAHTGITEGTFYRDQSWYFYQMGKYLERGDQTTRLLDIKYHTLLPSAQDVGSPVDLSQWNALLRSAAGYHAFRRIHQRGLSPAGVAGFLLINDSFPRSVNLCVRQVDDLLHALRGGFGLRGGNAALERLDEVRAALHHRTIEDIIRGGLHEFLDQLQSELIRISTDIARDFFGWSTAERSYGP